MSMYDFLIYWQLALLSYLALLYIFSAHAGRKTAVHNTEWYPPCHACYMGTSFKMLHFHLISVYCHLWLIDIVRYYPPGMVLIPSTVGSQTWHICIA